MTNSKRKGKRGELELAQFLRLHGYDDARRTNQYCGTEGTSDVVGLPGHHVEVKRTERLRLRAALDQAIGDSEGTGLIPIVAHRQNSTEWLITLRAEDYLTTIKRRR